jgi:Leucine-rich repeat (LRR) protein
VTAKTLLTVDLLISGFQIRSLNQSVMDMLSIDLLNNKKNKNEQPVREYMGVNIRSLILSNNSISRIRGDCLHNNNMTKVWETGSLQHLDLSHNLISELESETFDGFQSSLSSLILSHNLLQSMDFLLFPNASAAASGDKSRSSSKLTHVDLRHNRLRVIRESCFMMHPLLRYIDLSGNMIDTIDGGSFVTLLHLTHLDLSHNPLTNHADKLILTCFSHSLQVINLSNTSRDNMSSSIPTGLDPFVRQLILSHNHVSHIFLGDFDVDADQNNMLQTLDLSHNQIVEIEDDSLGRLLSLRELRLDQNLLSVIPQRLPSSLLILSVDQNSITSLPDSCVSSLVRLQSLHLAGNQITDLHPDALKGAASLLQLNLSGNSIRNLSYSMFHHCIKLQVLDISHNPIMHLSSYTFSGLNSLNHLLLSHVATSQSLMKIDSGTFTPLISLQVLDLDHSPGLFRALLHSNPQDVDDVSPLSFLTSVQQISLNFNQVSELNPEDADALKYWLQEQTQRETLRSISLREVEWKCDHSIQWLMKWIKSLHERMSFASTSSSFSPSQLPCCSYGSSAASAAVSHHQYSMPSPSSSSSQPPPLIPLSSGETMASDAANSSSKSRITLGSKEPVMQLTSSPPPSTFIPASASLASTSDPAASAAAGAVSAIVTSSMSTSAEQNEIPSSSSSAEAASLPSFRLDHVTDIICSSPENLRGRSLISLTEQELIQMHSPGEAEAAESGGRGEDGKERTTAVKVASAGKIERGMRMDQNSEGTHPSSLVSTSDQGITASTYSKGEAEKSLTEKNTNSIGSGSPSSSLSSPPHAAPLLVS